jgi:YHS domain-containing protein
MKQFFFTLLLAFLLSTVYLPSAQSCPHGKCDPANCAKMHEKMHDQAGHKCPGALGAEGAKAENLVVDPVCGMKFDKTQAEAEAEYKGKIYYFCRAGGKEAFLEDPGKYLAEE